MSTSQSALPASTWTRSLHANPQNPNHGPTIVGCAIAMIVVTTIAIALRFISRVLLVKPQTRSRLWWDDWTALASWTLSTSVCALNLYWVHIGFGKPIVVVDPAQQESISKVSFAISFPYDLGIALAKISALFFYHRIFSHLAYFRAALWITGGIIVAWLISFEFVNIFMCTPVDKFWIPTMEGGSCLSERAVLLGNAIPNLVTDLILLTLPIPALWGLRVDKKKKFGIFAAFVLGYGVVTVCILRVVTITQIMPEEIYSPNYSYFHSQILLMIETPIAIVCICLPSMVPLLRIALWRRHSNASSGFDAIAKHTYSLEPSRSNLPATEQSTRQIGVLGNVIARDTDDRSFQLTSPNTGDESIGSSNHNRHPSRHFGQEIGHQLSNMTHTFSWSHLHQNFSNESSQPSQEPSLDNLFHPGGCGETYQAFTTTSRRRTSFSVPDEYKSSHSKQPNRLSERVLHPHRSRSRRETSVDPETGLRWEEEIKVNTTVDIEYERRRSSEMFQRADTMSLVSPGPISKEISPF